MARDHIGRMRKMVKKNEYFWKTHGSVINAMGMKKIEEKETFEKTIGCVMHQVGTSRSNKEGAAARWWGELRIWSPLTFPTSST